MDKEQGKLIYALATKLPKQALPHLPLLSSLVAKKSLDQEAKLLAAIAFVQVRPPSQSLLSLSAGKRIRPHV